MSNPNYYYRLCEIANGIISIRQNEPWLGVRFIDPEYVQKTVQEQGFSCAVSYNRVVHDDKNKQAAQHLQALTYDSNIAKAMMYDKILFKLSPL